MSYLDGVNLANRKVSRMDFFWGKQKAKCDPRYGWKQGPKGCIRVEPDEDPEQAYGTDAFLTEHDKDLIEIQFNGSKGIDELVRKGQTRKNAVLYAKDAVRLVSQQNEGADFNKEIGELNRFAEAREQGRKDVLNKYGTPTFVSSSEESIIDGLGLGNIKGLSKDKEINYIKDAMMTRPMYSSNPDADLERVNKHYFG